MNWADFSVLGLLAMADIALLAYLRRRRSRQMQEEHLMRCLEIAVRRANVAPVFRPRATAFFAPMPR